MSGSVIWSTGIAEVQVIHRPSGLNFAIPDPSDTGVDGTEADHSSGAL